MDRGNIFSGSAFRVTVYATLVLIAVCTITAFAGYSFIKREQMAQLRDRIQTVTGALEEDYREGGDTELIENVGVFARSTGREDRVLSLLDADGRMIAGNTDLADGLRGAGLRRVPVAGSPGETAPYYITETTIGPFTVLAGESMTPMFRIEQIFVQTLIFIAALLTLIFVTLGFLTSRGVQRKLEHMGDTLQRVADGDADARLTVSSSNDQIDRVSETMNGHLDRLASLMTDTKTTAAAIAHDLKRPLSRALLGVEHALGAVERGNLPQAALEDVQADLANLNGIF